VIHNYLVTTYRYS